MSQQSDQKRLSVAIIVRNAADAIEQTLESVQAADEIVVADTGSDDGTRAVVKKSAVAMLTEIDWQDCFASARNQAWDQVTGDWVLWLDAGETIAAEDLEQIKDFIQNDADPDKSYVLVIQVPPSASGGSTEQIGRVRLMPNRDGIRFRGRVRESVFAALSDCGMSLGGLPYRISRGAREHLPELKQERARRNIRLADMEIQESSPRAEMLNCLGDAFQTLEDHQKAADCFRHALTLSAQGSSEMLEAYYGLLTSLDQISQQRDEQLQLAVAANEVFPQDAQLLCAMGGYLQASQQVDLAEKAYESAFRYGQIDPAVWHVADVREIAAVCFALSLQMKDKLQDSRGVLEEAIAINPASPKVRRSLLDVLVKVGDRDAALSCLEELAVDTEKLPAMKAVVRGATLAAQSNWIAAKAQLKVAYDAGYREPFCLRWYAAVLIAGGEVEPAGAVVKEWLAAEPQNLEALRYATWLQEKDSHPPDRQIRVDEAGATPLPLTPNPTSPTPSRLQH